MTAAFRHTPPPLATGLEGLTQGPVGSLGLPSPDTPVGYIDMPGQPELPPRHLALVPPLGQETVRSVVSRPEPITSQPPGPLSSVELERLSAIRALVGYREV